MMRNRPWSHYHALNNNGRSWGNKICQQSIKSTAVYFSIYSNCSSMESTWDTAASLGQQTGQAKISTLYQCDYLTSTTRTTSTSTSISRRPHPTLAAIKRRLWESGFQAVCLKQAVTNRKWTPAVWFQTDHETTGSQTVAPTSVDGWIRRVPAPCRFTADISD